MYTKDNTIESNSNGCDTSPGHLVIYDLFIFYKMIATDLVDQTFHHPVFSIAIKKFTNHRCKSNKIVEVKVQESNIRPRRVVKVESL